MPILFLQVFSPFPRFFLLEFRCFSAGSCCKQARWSAFQSLMCFSCIFSLAMKKRNEGEELHFVGGDDDDHDMVLLRCGSGGGGAVG